MPKNILDKGDANHFRGAGCDGDDDDTTGTSGKNLLKIHSKKGRSRKRNRGFSADICSGSTGMPQTDPFMSAACNTHVDPCWFVKHQNTGSVPSKGRRANSLLVSDTDEQEYPYKKGSVAVP
jgi:hypothetical protein